MSNDDDECDSASLLTVASQSEIDQFLRAQAAQITGVNGNSSDFDDEEENDESSIDGSFSTTFAQISSGKISDDLTELKWLNTFKLKDSHFKEQTYETSMFHREDRISQLINELKTYQKDKTEISVITLAGRLFVAFYSKRDDKPTPWALTLKQCYEYFQSNFKFITDRRDWKNLLRQALMTVPCFIQKKDENNKTRSVWTVDAYYRPLLTRAFTSPKTNSDPPAQRTEEKVRPTSTMPYFPPKVTVKAKAFPRLFERLCEEKSFDDNQLALEFMESSGQQRPRSSSLAETHSPEVTDQDEQYLSLSSPWLRKSKKPSKLVETVSSQKRSLCRSTIITPSPSVDHSYSNRRKNSPSRKRLSSTFSSHRANTRISRRIIEQDLKLLRQVPLDLSKNQRTVMDDVLDLSQSR